MTGPAVRRIARWLGLAAAPVFAGMALLTYAFGDGAADLLCSGGFVLGGMTPMYLLMSAVHLSPWLRLAAQRRSGRPKPTRPASGGLAA